MKYSNRYVKGLQTKLKIAKAELGCYKPYIDFVKRFNPRLFYRTPKDLISIIRDYKEELTGKACRK